MIYDTLDSLQVSHGNVKELKAEFFCDVDRTKNWCGSQCGFCFRHVSLRTPDPVHGYKQLLL